MIGLAYNKYISLLEFKAIIQRTPYKISLRLLLLQMIQATKKNYYKSIVGPYTLFSGTIPWGITEVFDVSRQFPSKYYKQTYFRVIYTQFLS